MSPIDLLTELVTIPSPSGEEAEAAALLVEWLAAHGFEAHVDEVGNAVGTRGTGSREIMLLGHIDTFPGTIPVHRQGDLLYGRGTVDAKGPLCTFAVAASQVEPPPDWRITVVGAVEEEAATSKGARHILSQREGQPPAYCLIGEPSQWDRLTLGYKGRLLLDLTLRVPFTHSAGAGRLPAEQAVDFWQAAVNLCTQLNAEAGATSAFTQLDPSLRHIASRDEGVFGAVDMSLGFRLPVGLNPDDLEVKLLNLIETLPPDTLGSFTFSGAEHAYKEGKSNPVVRAFLRAIRAAGGDPRFVVKTGTADMNVVGPVWAETPVVAYGPGDSSLDHTPTEHLSLTEYQQAITVLQGVLTTLLA